MPLNKLKINFKSQCFSEYSIGFKYAYEKAMMLVLITQHRPTLGPVYPDFVENKFAEGESVERESAEGR